MTPSNSNIEPLIMGINASHNGSVCLLRGQEVLVAIQEERLTREKRAPICAAKPSLSINYCLQAAGVKAVDLDLVVCSVQGLVHSDVQRLSLNPQLAGIDRDRLIYAPHHYCHALSAYATSGFQEADILVIDGVGSPKANMLPVEQALIPPGEDHWEWLSVYRANGNDLKPLKKLTATGSKKPELTEANSLGSMFELVSQIIFGERMHAGKVMGLAAYGQPSIAVGDFVVWEEGRMKFTNAFARRFDQMPLLSDAASEQIEKYQDLACSVQVALETMVMQEIKLLRGQSSQSRLCYAGGVALNTLLNERIIRESGYQSVYIIPAAEDSGVALGACYYGLNYLQQKLPTKLLKKDSFGKKYLQLSLQELNQMPGIRPNQSAGVIESIKQSVDRLCRGEVGAWFQDGSELGPRALGQRSMLCDPRPVEAKDQLNARIKKRESFRPFAPMVLKQHAKDWFDFAGADVDSPFMLRVADVLPHQRLKIPAVTHVDGSARVQTIDQENGLIYDLLQCFYQKTGVPILLNTSLNVNGEPIVETPRDAWRCLMTTPLAFCMIEQQLFIKANQSHTLLDFFPKPAYTCSSSIYKTRQLDNVAQMRQIEIHTRTPWGVKSAQLPLPTYFFLLKIDGKQSGWDLLRHFHKDANAEKHRAWAIDILQQLHQIYAVEFSVEADN